jgi:hypothetical protein
MPANPSRRLPIDSVGRRDAWRCVIRADGALINPPDIFLYLPQFADAPARVVLHAPVSQNAFARLFEITHEFVHAWNLVAISPGRFWRAD